MGKKISSVNKPKEFLKEEKNNIAKKKSPRVKGKGASDVLQKDKAWPIVAVGASAGGLEAYSQFLKALPSEPGISLILVQHLDPKHDSILSEILSRETGMPVCEAKDGMAVEVNHVYVMPPNTDMAILNSVLSLMPRKEIKRQHMPIDYFLRTLAEDQKNKAIGVIMSGTGSDGTLGLRAIKAEGGITFAQEPKSAKFDGMPHSAIASGVVDFILSVEDIAKKLLEIVEKPYGVIIKLIKPDEDFFEGEQDFNKIFILLRTATGVDFSNYKLTSIKRRIARRMILHKIEGISIYIRYLSETPSEVMALYSDLLINVTSFFREPETCEALKKKVFPRILKDRSSDMPVRIWVPGCSTGEEAYSIAIYMLEYLQNINTSIPIQIFATDISDMAIERARSGIYLENIAMDVSCERLRRFFVKVEGGYQINKTIRDMCIFARQDLTRDPPFSRMDIISCRNVLIYLGSVLQKKIIPTFHYALSPEGLLILGNSESVGSFADLFSLVDKKYKVYAKKITALRPTFTFTPESSIEKTDTHKATEEPVSGTDIQKEADRLILSKYAPPGVLINDALEILQFRGRTGRYLEPASGMASLNLLQMTREGLLLELRTAVHRAKKEDIPVKKTDIRVKYNGHFIRVNIEVIPLRLSPFSEERYFLVLFEELPLSEHEETPEKKTKTTHRKKTEELYVTMLQHELTATKEYLQSVIEEHEAANEELRSAIEEIQSSNEELQSTNEELETAKEELQSTNEELTTVNEELQNRNMELSQANNDLLNLLSSVSIPIVILGSDLTIKRFTPMTEKVLNLISSDVGRPLSDIRLNIVVDNLEKIILEVIDTLNTKEMEVSTFDGRWYFMRIRPYKTVDNRIDGAMMSFVEIDSIKRKSIEQVKEAQKYAEAIIETVREPVLILNGELCVTKANKVFYKTFRTDPFETENKFVYSLGNCQWDIASLRELLEDILPNKTSFSGFEVETEFPGLGRRKFILNAHQLRLGDDKEHLILLAMEEVISETQVERCTGKKDKER